MEDEERQKKLEAGKAKLAEYRQRKAYVDFQKKQKKKKKKKSAEDSEGESQERVEVGPDQTVGGEEVLGVGRGESQGNEALPTTEFTFTKTLKSGETVRHDQTYKIEPESEVSTTAEDCSSEEEVEPLQQITEGRTVQDMEDELAARTQTVEELNQGLEEIGSDGTETVQQLQDFEAALKQRDGIITQLTSNLQQAREEKDEIMKEFLALTEQSQKLQIQFQQLQAGETLRNTSHSSTAADLLQARQQLVQYQQQLEEMNTEAGRHQKMSGEQLEHISQLQHKLAEMEMSGRRSEESFLQKINEKDSLIAERDKAILSREQSEETFAQTLKDKNQLISEQTAIIKEHEWSLTLLKKELALAGRTTEENIMYHSDDKDLILAEKERVISEQDCSLIQLTDQLETSEKRLRELQHQVAARESELEKSLDEMESLKSEMESCRSQFKKEQMEFESCKEELAASRQKERMSSNEIMQLMGTVENLQKRCYQGNVSESDTVQKMQEDAARKLELLRAELDEMYGQQIVQMKQEVNLQHAARVQLITEQHQAEIELLKAQQHSTGSTGEVEALTVRIKKLQDTLEQSQAMYDKARHELNQVIQEKLKLQAKVEDLLRDLSAAKEEVELVSATLISKESNQDELQQLQETIEVLRSELLAAQEAAEEAETKHESEITNYKIKLEMLEREKDAVLDRMAESQEAELERLRTQLLFSHEEELINLREELQRENFLNTENLLNEAAIRHQKALDELRISYAEQLDLLQTEKTSFASERDELLHQISGLKEDLKLALHSPKADELVHQLQELQLELEELRKGAQERVKMQDENRLLLKKTEVLENQTKEKKHYWEEKLKELKLEKETLIEAKNTLGEELESKNKRIETQTAENNQIQQQVAELCEEIERQRTTFSFAEKNFEVNYLELKEEYTCLIEAKTQLEERTRRETLEFEAKIARLQLQIQELEEGSRNIKMEEAETGDKAVTEKGAEELMEKLNVTLSEKKSLADRFSEVTGQLNFTESKVEQLEDELVQVKQENTKVIADNESLRKKLEKKQEIKREQKVEKEAQEERQTVEPVCSSEDHRLQIRSLQEEIKALQSLLRAAEAERDSIRQTLELHRLSQTPSPAAVRSSGEGPVEGRSSPHKSAASGSNRRKRRQRSKQERQAGSAFSDSREEKQREEKATVKSTAKEEMLPQMQSQVMSCSPERAGKEDSADGYQGDTGYSNRAVKKQGMGCHTECVAYQRAERAEETPEHDEFRLQMEAQRLSLTQIHAAQLELLQEETDTCTRSLELKIQHQDEQKIFKYQNVMEAVSEECTEIIQYFQTIFGKKVLESDDAANLSPISEERQGSSESSSIVLQARELYINLQQVRISIEHEHHRLSHLQTLLRADGNKISELQKAYDELKINSEKKISDLQMQLDTSFSSNKNVKEQVGASASPSDLQGLKAEAQEKLLQLEESHRQEMEHLRAHYQQQAAETEERYATDLFVLQQRLQEVTGDETYYSLSSAPEFSSEMTEHRREGLKDPSEEELSEGGAGSFSSARSPALTVQLQALRTALDHKYTQEVAALREQHSSELRRLKEEKEQEMKRRERREEGGESKLDLNCVSRAGSSAESLDVAGQLHVEEKHQQERVEEEVAKAIVQMSVEFAQQSELARINKRARQMSTSMQTQLGDEEVEDRELKRRTPRASLSAGTGLEEERQRLEMVLEEKNAEIRKLKEELQKTERRQALKKRNDDEGRFDEGDGTQTTLAGGFKLSIGDVEESSDKDSERNLLLKANKKLSQVLVDVLKTTAAAEKTLGLHMQSLRDTSAEVQPSPSTMQRENTEPKNRYSSESCQSGETGADNMSIWSGQFETDEGLEMSQQMMDNLLLGAEPQLRNEEYFMGISSRLQAALEKMLITITDTTEQVEHARVTQTELMRESFRHNQEIDKLLQKQEELQERLSEEARAREQLALELHRAEGLIDGYTGERAALEEQLRQKEELQQSLAQELQVTGSRLHELEQERLQMLEERELLSRQQDAMREEAGPRELRLVEAAMVAAPEADLLEETEKLMKEKVDVQRQAEKENTDLLKQVKLLEAELEEQVNRVIELEHVQKTESGDLQQQIQVLEKQLEKNRKFLDEQAVDREHERDVFQQEIQKLEQQLKSPQKLQIGSEQKKREVDRVAFKVEQLTSQLKEKADWCSELLLSSEQLRRELGERDEEIEKLESRIRELEQALLASAESLEKVEQKNQHESITEAKHSTLEAQLQTEREALERKEKEICNLEEQLEQFREELENKSEEVQQLHMQLEIQRKEISSQQQYLETRDSMLQVMEEKDREIALLNEQIIKLQHMETASDNKEFDDREEMIKDLESQVECLRSEQERLKRNKEEELEQLNDVIEKLQQELANIEQKQAAEEEEDAKGEVESGTWEPTKEEYGEMKQKMDRATKELETLRMEHSKLLDRYLLLKQSADALAETENLDSSEELEEALREKTAALVVLQAEVQALEQSASYRVEELGLRIQELEDLVGEKDSEMNKCQLLVEQTQSYADDLQAKIYNLEENLRENVAAALVSQATLEAFQQQSEESKQQQELQRLPAPHVLEFTDFGIPQLDFSTMDQVKWSPTGKVVHLTQKLRDLEVGLIGMQRDQELQKQLLSSSEEEVLEYERRLAVLMELLNQMKAGPCQRTSSSVEISSSEQSAVTKHLQELQEVKDEVITTKQQLELHKESCSGLEQELRDKTVTTENLQDQLQMVSNVKEDTTTVELEGKLMEAQNEAASTKEELNSCKERLEKLQELLQEREMTIAHLKGELFQVKASEDRADMTELIQELKEVKCDATSAREELASFQERNEILQEDFQARVGSILKLEEELQEVRSSRDSTKDELASCLERNEKLQDDLQARESSVFKLEEELREVRSRVDASKEELASYQERNEKLQEDLQARVGSILKLEEELQEVRSNMDSSKDELTSCLERNEKLQEDLQAREIQILKLEEELREVRSNVDSTKELDGYKQQNEKLLEDLQAQESLVFKLEEELQEVRSRVDTSKEELTSYREKNEKLQEDLQARESSVFKLETELQEVRSHMDSTKDELNSCLQRNEKLQEDLQARESSVFKLEKELQEVRSNVDTTKELDGYKQQNEKLLEDLQARESSILQLKEALKELRSNVDITKEELKSYKQQNEKLLQDLQVRESTVFKHEELQELRNNVDTTKEELNSCKQQNEKLLEELHNRELYVLKLKEEFQVVQTALLKTAESGPPSSTPSPSPSPSPRLSSSASFTSTSQPKRKGAKPPTAKGGSSKDKPSLSKKNSASSNRSNSRSGQQHVAVTDSFTQTEPLREPDHLMDGRSATKDELEEVIGEFQEKIAQMQELHAAEILDMEARHISESENLRRDTQALEDECKAMKAVIDKLCSAEAPPSRQDRPAFKDGYTSDSSSDYSQRTGYDVPSLQQEFRTTPEGARRETDDPLPDRIKMLLREVHQEGMQVLSLSEPGSQFNVEGWVKERDALLATVESLKGLITQMQTHSKAQTSGGADWRAELLDAVRQVFLRERSVLKNALYSQLDLLDTSDAVVHLNQLEHRLAEQDSHHKEAMGLLHTAERSTLISEIHQLRRQLEHLHPNAQPGLTAAGECSTQEQRERAGTDGAAEGDRLLVEELKVELSQTKLELETTLKAQHKHLKELDALRAEVSQKSAGLDALNDQLMGERKRSRDLQWAVEKERCQSGRTEESKREELEDLQLTLEEQKAHVVQLTQTLEQERQASSLISQKAEQDNLSLQRHLQELQVQLETERAKALEMSSALGRERELRAGLSSESDPPNEEGGREEEGSLLAKLQRELDEKHSQVVDLLSQVEDQRLEVVRKEEELTLASQRSNRDKEALLEAQAQLEVLRAQISDVQEQLKKELETRKRLEERLDQLGQEEESGASQINNQTQAVWHSESTDRTKDWVLQQKSGSVQSTTVCPRVDVSPTTHISGPHHGPWRTVDKIVGKLHLISSKIHTMTSKTTGRPTAEVDSDELSWIQSSVDEVITMLQQSPGLPSLPESVSLLPGGSSSTLTERLLRQNAELTGFVSRLTEEKNDLRNHTLRLEEELQRYRQSGPGSGDRSSRRGGSKMDSAGLIHSQERESWTRERIRLEKALHQAQSQVARLMGEVRSETLREITGPEADNSALKRMYGKYLRSESFRKALIYQKKYLLLLLGGFQECEEATLSLLSRMGGRPSLSSLESYNQRRRGLMRFRSAVRVSIALSRMRFLMKRWHKATGMSSTASCGVNKNGAGSDVRDSPYLHPSSVEMYRERGGGGGGGVCSGRGRSGRESPRSGVSSTQHRFHLAAEHGPLTCSHLQSYDPDRALTDYISRLEALQRRLGSVTSGASSYAQLHFGLRR